MSPEPEAQSLALAAILCGGRASRMGTDKALVTLGGLPLVERVRAQVQGLVGRVVAVGGSSAVSRLGFDMVPDRYPGANSMGGIATALGYARECCGEGSWVLALACDLPFLEPRLLAHLADLRSGHDVVVPRVAAGYEPLCALYRTTCLPTMEELIHQDHLRIITVFDRVRTREVEETELRRFDPGLCSFINLNRPEDLERARQLVELETREG